MPGSAESSRVSPPRTAAGIELEGVIRRFGSLTAVREVSFSVPPGRLVGLVGSDGAGKTTLLRMIATLLPPNAGSIRVGGIDAAARRAEVKRRIGYMPQRFGLYPDLTVAENLDFVMDVYGITGAERRRRRERYLAFSNLDPFVARRAADLSGGMKQKLGLACVLVHEPEVLILDEPTNGVDPVSRQEFWEILGDMNAQGMTILVSTAYLDEAERCRRLLVMHNGRILADAAPGAIRAGWGSLEEALIECIRAADAALDEERFGG
jgi:ABC-2 type transport system ATP-binding protein